MELTIHPDTQSVLEFMQMHVKSSLLVATAARLPELAKLLWGHLPQEPCTVMELSPSKIDLVVENQ
jgi:hypothetical protein